MTDPLQPAAKRLHIILIAGALLLAAILSFRSIDDLDYGIHIATGRWILQNGAVPTTDPFSWSFSSHAYIAYHWGFQVILAWLEGVLGLWGPVGLRCLLVTMTGLAVAWACRVRRVDPLIAVLCGVLAIVAAEWRFAMRPELFSNLLLVLTVLALDKYHDGSKRAAFALPLIFLGWVNTHVYVLGLAVLLPCIAQDAIRGKLRGPLLLGTALSVGALFLNPYGWEAVIEPLRLMTRMESSNVFAQHISELESPFKASNDPNSLFQMHGQYGAWMALLALSIPAAFGLIRLRRFADLVFLCALAVLSTLAVRNMSIFVIGTVPALATGLSEFVSASLPIVRRNRHRISIALGVAIAILCVRVASGAWYASQRRDLHFAVKLEESALAIQAADFVRDHSLAGKGFNNLDVGGALLLRAPGHKIFIDGRNEVTGEDFFKRYLWLLEPANFMQFVELEKIEYIVVSHRQTMRLLRELLRSAQWTVAHYDGVAVVLVRKAGPNGSLPEQPLPNPITDEEERWMLLSKIFVQPTFIESLSRWLLGGEEMPEELSKTGTFLLMLDRWANAERPLLEAAIKAPDFWETSNNLGALYWRLQSWEAAAASYRTVLMLKPRNALARRRAEEAWALFQGAWRNRK
jgi:tetratricopeptide (TPR) repeat protein